MSDPNANGGASEASEASENATSVSHQEQNAKRPEDDQQQQQASDGVASGDGQDAPVFDKEIEAMKQKVADLEEEAARLQNMYDQQQDGSASSDDVDGRSVFCGNVDFGSSPEELQAHFQSCGTINRVTILWDKFTGRPKGFAYIEFADRDGVEKAVQLTDSQFRGRPLKISPKRTNVPGMGRAQRGARGFRRPFGGYRGRGFRRRGFRPYGF